MDGIILINKEKGPTSFDTINALKRKFRLKKIGHAGTLDPMGEGLLVALIGSAVKLNNYLHLDKHYDIEVTFGIQTDTDDTEGKVIKEMPVPENLEKLLLPAIQGFIGDIKQVPPAYSAIKKEGKKMYELAREGVHVEQKPRDVRIDSIMAAKIEGNKAQLRVACSTGTYMRSLARDLGEAVGSCATMSALNRTRVGDFRVENSFRISEITSIEDIIIPIRDTLYFMSEYLLTPAQAKDVKNGMPIKNRVNAKGFVKLIHANEVIAIGECHGEEIRVKRGI